MWTCDVMAGLKLLEKTVGRSFCLYSICPVEGAPVILFKSTAGETFVYEYTTETLTKV